MKTVQEFGSKMFEFEVNLHIMHLQTGSYAQHNALNLYQKIVEHRDSFLEAWQGEESTVKGYPQITITEGKDPVNYLKEFKSELEEFRETLTKGYLQQMIDNILEDINSTLFFLKNLS